MARALILPSKVSRLPYGDGDKVILNDEVMVTITDILTTNGVRHVIDAVLPRCRVIH
jgi:hypothetical protein